ncbi:unnamed protein product, partial [Ascophyllum nodosum]
WRSKLRTNAALRTLFGRLQFFLAVLRNCKPWCPFPGAAMLRGSHQSQSVAQLPLGVSTPTAFWPRSFLGRDHQFSGPHDGCGECDYYVAHIAVSRRVCPGVPSNRGGYLLSKLGISHQAPTVHWRL